MNELEREKSTSEPGSDPIIESTETAPEEPALQPGLRERVKKFLSDMQQQPVTKQARSKDRTRSLALLIGGTVGAVLLFLGVFSTPPARQDRETGARNSPTLGRPSNRNEGTTMSRGSVVPLLSADLASNEAASEQISPADIQGTSRRSSADERVVSQENEATVPAIRTPNPPPRNLAVTGGPTSEPRDLAGPYRLNSATGAPTYSYGAPATSATWAEPLRAFSNSTTTAPAPNRIETVTPAKSSIVFMRSPNATESSVKTAAAVNAAAAEQVSLLSPGTRLVARLEAAATTAVKTPVVAVVEYNYERDGAIVVPAGTKIFGEVQQASAQGYLSVRFHALQMPNGMEEKIEGAAMGLDQKPLKGDVSGKNTGKKFVSRTLSGIGTVAAYVVGAGGAGLSRTITGETLLRDRLASNIALAGEQELMNSAYSQNISVTVPANTRFYVVLQKPAMNTLTQPSRNLDAAQRVEIPSAQELRELMDLRREINRMYQESNASAVPGAKP